MGEWLACALGELISLEYGSALGAEERTGEGYPVFGSNGVVGHHSMPLVSGPGIVVGRKGSAGALAWSESDFWPIDTTYWVKPKTVLELRWVYDALRRCGLERLHSSTGVPGLNRDDACERRVPVPPLEEQRRIAEILGTIDETVQATERVIAKLRALLAGMIDELAGRHLREGRPGSRLREMLQHRMDYRGRTPKKLGMEWGGGQIPALSANNVQMGEIDFSRECYLGSEDLYARWMTRGPTEAGDVLLTMEAPLGNVARIPDSGRYILSQRVVLLRFDPSSMFNEFAYWLMRSDTFQGELRRRSTGTTATGIRRAELEEIEVPFVAAEDQQLAVATLAAHEAALSCEIAELGKLRATRSGLAADLLSGSVRTVVA